MMSTHKMILVPIEKYKLLTQRVESQNTTPSGTVREETEQRNVGVQTNPETEDVERKLQTAVHVSYAAPKRITPRKKRRRFSWITL